MHSGEGKEAFRLWSDFKAEMRKFSDKLENFVTSKLLSVGGRLAFLLFFRRLVQPQSLGAPDIDTTHSTCYRANFSRESCKPAKQKVFPRKSRVPAKQSAASPKACQQTRSWISKQTFRKLCFDFVFYRRVNLMTQLLLEPRCELLNRFKRL